MKFIRNRKTPPTVQNGREWARMGLQIEMTVGPWFQVRIQPGRSRTRNLELTGFSTGICVMWCFFYIYFTYKYPRLWTRNIFRFLDSNRVSESGLSAVKFSNAIYKLWKSTIFYFKNDSSIDESNASSRVDPEGTWFCCVGHQCHSPLRSSPSVAPSRRQRFLFPGSPLLGCTRRRGQCEMVTSGLRPTPF